MAKGFASQGDLAEKTISFTEIGKGLFAFTAEGDPNSGVIIGDDSVMIIEAQATPRLANKVIEKVREVTDKPISHVVLTHYHAVRVLGASRVWGRLRSSCPTRRGQWLLSAGRRTGTVNSNAFPRLFEGHESIPGLTWPTTTFSGLDDRLSRQSEASTSGRLAAPIRRAIAVIHGYRMQRRHVHRRYRRRSLGLLLRLTGISSDWGRHAGCNIIAYDVECHCAGTRGCAGRP